MAKKSKSAPKQMSFAAELRAGPGHILADIDTAGTPAFAGNKAAAADLMAATAGELGDLQERLYAESKAGGQRSVLLVVQGTDTSGKGGIMRHVVGSVDPQGIQYTAFKAPSAEELDHPFLWRIRRALPPPGHIGVFDRSHYEDVLIARVRQLASAATLGRRYGQINRFEESVATAGTTIIKVLLHLSRDEQKARLQERLDRPEKHWKYRPGDVDERLRWPAYQEAYQLAVERCSSEAAPWYVVPADRKWYARLAVQQLLLEHLRLLAPQWPAADFDVEAEKLRLAAS